MQVIAVIGMSREDFFNLAKTLEVEKINTLQGYAETKITRWQLIESVRDLAGRHFDAVEYGHDPNLMDKCLVALTNSRVKV